MNNELVVIQNLELVPFFTKESGVDDTLAQIAIEARAHVPDVSTLKGRNAIKANVTLVQKSKTYLEKNGKELAAEYKAIPKQIDATRRKTNDFLNELQKEVREKLTEWEAEQEKIKAEEAFLLLLEDAHKINDEFNEHKAQQKLMDHMQAIIDDNEFDRATAEKVEAEKQLLLMLEDAYKIDGEFNAHRDAEIKKQAAEDARLEAERLAEENADRLEREKQEALDLVEQQKEDAIQAELDAEEAEKQRVIDAEAAETKRLADVEQERIDTENRIEADRLAEEKRVNDAAILREKNKKHLSSVMTQTKESIMALGLSEDDARKVTTALRAGSIANVGKIQF